MILLVFFPHIFEGLSIKNLWPILEKVNRMARLSSNVYINSSGSNNMNLVSCILDTFTIEWLYYWFPNISFCTQICCLIWPGSLMMQILQSVTSYTRN
jgi:hypothetical protein